MDGFTVSNAKRFVDTGQSRELKTDVFPSVGGTSAVDKAGGKSFSDTLKDAIHSVNDLQKTSNKAMEKLATGQTDNIADVMIAAEKADIALKLMVQVRNKIIDAYQEVMKMQV